MNTEELTQLSAVQQTILTRHDREIDEIRAILNQTAAQQALNTQDISELKASLVELRNITVAQQALSMQSISELRASIMELRNVVSDYIQGRSQI